MRKSVETLPVAGTSIESLDLDRLNFYLAAIIKDPEVPRNQKMDPTPPQGRSALSK
uniref:hypothetical protein n=1 Tax=Candidatus Electrothrix sp. TaxID=2170559 RepID=UPI004055E233